MPTLYAQVHMGQARTYIDNEAAHAQMHPADDLLENVGSSQQAAQALLQWQGTHLHDVLHYLHNEKVIHSTFAVFILHLLVNLLLLCSSLNCRLDHMVVQCFNVTC